MVYFLLFLPCFIHLFTALSQKRFHSRYNFGYGILLYIRKMPIFRSLNAHFGCFEGIFIILTINPPSSAPLRQKWRILYAWGFNRSRNDSARQIGIWFSGVKRTSRSDALIILLWIYNQTFGFVGGFSKKFNFFRSRKRRVRFLPLHYIDFPLLFRW